MSEIASSELESEAEYSEVGEITVSSGSVSVEFVGFERQAESPPESKPTLEIAAIPEAAILPVAPAAITISTWSETAPLPPLPAVRKIQIIPPDRAEPTTQSDLASKNRRPRRGTMAYVAFELETESRAA